MPFGDISPDSFLRDESGIIFLCGIPAFGFPPPKDRLEEDHRTYLAPEPFEERNLPFSQDIFALGAFAHQLLTRRPFGPVIDGDSLAKHFEEKTKGLLALYPDLPTTAEDFLKKSLCWTPGERLSTKELLALVSRDAEPRERFRVYWQQISQLRSDLLSWRTAIYCVGLALLCFLIVGPWKVSSLGSFFHSKGLNVTKDEGAVEDNRAKPPDTPSAVGVLDLKQKMAVAFGGGQGPSEAPSTAKVQARSSGEESVPALMQFAALANADAIRQSVLSATPTDSLMRLLLHSGEIPRDQFESAARELLSRNVLPMTGRIGLLALLRSAAEDVSQETREALLRTLDDSSLLRDVETISQWENENAVIALTSMVASSHSRELIYRGFNILANREIRIEPLRSLLALAKTQRWPLDISSMKAIAGASLAAFMPKKELRLALKALSEHISPLELEYLIGANKFSGNPTPWCADLFRS